MSVAEKQVMGRICLCWSVKTGEELMYCMPAQVGLSGLGVTCLPQDPRFADSNPAEVDGFFQDKYPEHKSSGRDFKPWVQSLRFQAR